MTARDAADACSSLRIAALVSICGMQALSGAIRADAGAHAVSRAGPDSGFGSVYCGPRCVQRVLREYGVEADLIDLIREMQWPAVEQGSSMRALADALGKRQIFTMAVDIDPKYDIEWTQPAIVYLEQSGVGHYVVWMPSNDAQSAGRVWDYDVTDAVKLGAFNKLRGGPVLLTSDREIPRSAVVGRHLRGARRGFRSLMLPIVLSVSGFIGGWIMHQQLSSPGVSATRR